MGRLHVQYRVTRLQRGCVQSAVYAAAGCIRNDVDDDDDDLDKKQNK